MKFKPNEKMTTRAVYLFLSLAGTILFYLLITNISQIFSGFGAVIGYIMPIIYAFVIAFLLNPLLKVYERRLFSKIKIKKTPLPFSVRRGLSILLTYVSASLLIFLFMWLVLPSLGDSLTGIQTQIPSYGRALQSGIDGVISWVRELPNIGNSSDNVGLVEMIGSEIVLMMEEGLRSLSRWIGSLAPGIMAIAGSVASFLVNLTLGALISIYFLVDKERLFAQLRKLVTAIFPQKAADFLYDFAKDTNKIFSSFIIGNIIDSFIVAVICFVGVLFIHSELAILIAVMVGVTNLIPYFGPFIGAIPSGLLLLSISPGKAVAFVIFILVLQQLDGNILAPAILGDSMGLSPLLVVFSIFLFGGMMGIAGVFFGVPIFAIIYSLVKRIVNYLLQRKERSTTTADYDSKENPLPQSKGK